MRQCPVFPDDPGLALKVHVGHRPAAVGLPGRVRRPPIGKPRGTVDGWCARVWQRTPRARAVAHAPVLVAIASAKRLEVENPLTAVARPSVSHLAAQASPAKADLCATQRQCVKSINHISKANTQSLYNIKHMWNRLNNARFRTAS